VQVVFHTLDASLCRVQAREVCSGVRYTGNLFTKMLMPFDFDFFDWLFLHLLTISPPSGIFLGFNIFANDLSADVSGSAYIVTSAPFKPGKSDKYSVGGNALKYL
jgi:hypothetical protein